MTVKGGKEEVIDVKRSKMAEAEAALEERKLSEMLIPKKKQRLYKKIMLKKKKTAREVSVTHAPFSLKLHATCRLFSGTSFDGKASEN